MQHLLPTLGFIGLLIALVSAVDRIMDKETKKSLGQSIKEKIVGQRFEPGNVNNPIAFIEKLRPFGLRSALTSGIFSVISLLFVLYVQYFALGYNFGEMFSGVKEEDYNIFVAFIAFMVMSNVIVDYISFTQTLVIIRLINKTDSKKSAFILLFTDLLASINIFSMVYAAFLAFGVQQILNDRERGTFVVSIEDSEVTAATEKIVSDIGLANGNEFRHVSLLRINALNVDGTADISQGYLFGTEPVKAEVVFPMMKSAFQLQFGDDEFDMRQIKGSVALYATFPTLMTDYVIKGEINYWRNAEDFFVDWYSVAYLLTDDVQDNFFSVTGLSPGFQKVDRLRYEANERVASVTMRDFVLNWCLKDQSAKQLSDPGCASRLVYASSDFPTLRTKLASLTEIGGQLPLYTFFFTSLSLTLVIYLFYLSIYLFQFGMVAAKRLSLPITRFGNFEEHPITLLSLPMVLLAGFLYFWLSL